MGGRVERFVFIIHPLLYEEIQLETSALQLYAAWEQEVKACCLEELARLPPSTMVVQLAGASTELIDAARDRLGPARALHLLQNNGRSTELAGVFADLCAQIRQHMTAAGLTFDSSASASEMWGESFEGCVPGYGSAFAHGLGLAEKPTIAFDKCVCDGTFMYGATLLTTQQVEPDVEAMIFQLHDRSFIGVFQPRLTPMWIDDRVIAVGRTGTMMCKDCVRAITKQGYPIWPSTPPGAKALYEDGKAPFEVRFRLSASGAPNDAITYIHGLKVSKEEFYDLMRSARVLSRDAHLRPIRLEAASL